MEYESNYALSMASYALLLTYSRFFGMRNGALSFKLKNEGTFFRAYDGTRSTFRYEKHCAEPKVMYGTVRQKTQPTGS